MRLKFEPLDAGSVAEFVRTRALDRGITVSQAVDELLAIHDLDEEATRFFVRAGIISQLNNAHHQDRREGRALWRISDPIPPSGPVEKVEFAALQMVHTDAEGRPKSLLDFNDRDWATFETVCRSQAIGWMKRANVAQNARIALGRFGTTSTRELPTEALRDLDHATTDAWSRSPDDDE